LAGREHWLGLDKIYELTQRKTYQLRIRLTSATNTPSSPGVEQGQAVYATFKLLDNVSLVQYGATLVMDLCSN
jgi:hypothetical protein